MLMFPPVPQTGQHRLPLSDEDEAKLLRRRNAADRTDLFATDPNPDISRLGRLILRRDGVFLGDYFALADLCAQQAVDTSQPNVARLRVFYISKTIAALRLPMNASSADAEMPQQAIHNFVEWVIEIAKLDPSAINLATALWTVTYADETQASVASELPVLFEELAGALLPPDSSIEKSIRPATGPLSLLETSAPDDNFDIYSFVESVEADDLADVANRLDDTILSPEDEAFLSQDSIDSMPSREKEHQSADLPHALPSDLDTVEANAKPAIALAPDVEDDYAIGERISNRYEVRQRLYGGMGLVYLCYDHEEKIPVALKTFQSRFLKNERATARFTQEALTWVRLEKHQHIVKALMVRTYDHRPYIILEQITGPDGLGTDLRSWIDQNYIDLPTAISFGLHICLGMQHATRQVPGLVHRDLKPGNVLVNQDHIAKVTDYGLVRTLDITPDDTGNDDDDPTSESVRLTRQGARVGTAPYMSPEQCRSEDVDERADIYAFGCVMYEMLTLRLLFRARTFPDWMKAHQFEEPTPPISHHFEIPGRLQGLVMACLAKAREDRPPTWGVLVNELADIYESIMGTPPVLEVSGQAMAQNELLDKARSLGELGYNNEAIESYNRALELDDANARAWARRGQALRIIGQNQDALADVEQALKLNPRHGWAYIVKGRILEEMGQFERALAAYESSIQIKPDVQALYSQSLIYYTLGLWEEALEKLDQAIALNPKYHPSWAKRGQILRAQGQYLQALTAYNEALEIDNRYGWAWNGKGICLKALGRLEEAYEAFQHALEFRQDDVWVWYNLAETLLELNRNREALKAALQAVRIQPDHFYSWSKLAQIYRRLGSYEEALKAYQKTLSINPNHVWSINGKGIVLERLNRDEEALEAYRLAAELAPDDVYPWYNQGELHLQRERFDEAIVALEQAVKVNANHSRSWARLGYAYGRSGESKQALKAFDRALKLDKRYAWAWNERGIVLEAIQQSDEALKSYQQATLHDPKAEQYWYKLAVLQIDLGYYESALESLASAIKLNNRYHRAWERQGQALRRLHRYEEALDAYSRALEIAPDDAWAWHGRGMAFSALEHHQEALQAFQKAVDINPNGIWFWFKLMDEYIVVRQHNEALDAADHALAINPDHMHTLAKKGQILRRMGHYDEALAQYDKALTLDATYAWAWNERGLVLEHLKRYEEALASYERAAQHDGSVIWYWQNQIQPLLVLGNLTHALDVTEHLIEMDANNEVAWGRKGQILRRMQQFEDAVIAYEKALEIDPMYGWAWDGLALTYVGLDDLEQAMTYIKKATDVSPNDVWLWYDRGVIFMRLSRWNDALMALERALVIDSNHQPSRQKLAEVRRRLEE